MKITNIFLIFILLLSVASILIFNFLFTPPVEIIKAGFVEDSLTLKSRIANYEVGETMLFYMDSGEIKLKKIKNEYNMNVAVDQRILSKDGKVVSENKNVLSQNKNLPVPKANYVFFIPIETENLKEGSYILETILIDKNRNSRKKIETFFNIKETKPIMKSLLLGNVENETFISAASSLFDKNEPLYVYVKLSDLKNEAKNIALDVSLENENGLVLFDFANVFNEIANETIYKRAIPLNISLLDRGVYRISVTARYENSVIKRSTRFEVI